MRGTYLPDESFSEMAHINLRYTRNAVRQRWCRVAGFTLLELIITMAVLAVMAAYGIPQFSQMMERNRTVRLAQELKGILIQGKSEAVMRNQKLQLTALTDGGVLSGGTDYSDGNWYIVLHEPSAAVGTLAEASNNAIALLHGTKFDQNTFRINGTISDGRLAYFTSRRGAPNVDISLSISDSSQTLSVQGNKFTGRIYACSTGGKAYGFEGC
uniref:pilus assembly FimT family protein n=1 Tax=Thaumasiovibrio occultus TaxID=1891184 RepID=UPI000B34DC63|nr:GspH/FimT family pseudopilin [Thaumasiovibrio occultus]